MALFVRQDESRTKYQQQIAAELQEKMRKKQEEHERPDGVDDSAFIQNTKRTTSLAWIWVVIIITFVAALVWILIQALAG